MIVYLPMQVLDHLRATARSRVLTYAELLVESTVHLPEVEQAFGRRETPSPGAGGMPGRSVVQAGRAGQQPGVQVQLRLDGHQVRWLDEQARRLAAPSRSALVVALLRTHLAAPRAAAN